MRGDMQAADKGMRSRRDAQDGVCGRRGSAGWRERDAMRRVALGQYDDCMLLCWAGAGAAVRGEGRCMREAGVERCRRLCADEWQRCGSVTVAVRRERAMRAMVVVSGGKRGRVAVMCVLGECWQQEVHRSDCRRLLEVGSRCAERHGVLCNLWLCL